MNNEEIARYQKVLSNLEIDVGYMKRNMAVFKKLRQLVKFEGEIIQGLNWLLNWIVDTYSTDIAMSIRRLVDTHRNPHCQSLYKFLIELKECTSLSVTADELKQDVDKLDGEKNPTLKKLLRFTLQDRAHSDERSKPPEGITISRYTDISFDEEAFPEAEKIENLFVKYYKLVNGKEPEFMKESYIEHSESMINEIDNTFSRICKEKLSD